MKRIAKRGKTMKKSIGAYETMDITLRLKSVDKSGSELEDIIDKILRMEEIERDFRVVIKELKGIIEVECEVKTISDKKNYENETSISGETYTDIDPNEDVLDIIYYSFKNSKTSCRKDYKLAKEDARKRELERKKKAEEAKQAGTNNQK